MTMRIATDIFGDADSPESSEDRGEGIPCAYARTREGPSGVRGKDGDAGRSVRSGIVQLIRERARRYFAQMNGPREYGAPGVRLWTRMAFCLGLFAFLPACQPEIPGDAESESEEQVRTDSPIPGGDPWSRSEGDFDPADTGFALMDSSNRVQVSLVDAPGELAPGATHRFRIRIEMEPDWHLMANPASMEFLIPTEVRFPANPAAVIERIDYPEGEDFLVEVLDESVKVYKGTVEIPVTLRIAEDAPTGRHRIAGTLRVQACDDSVCLAPATLPLEFAFMIEDD